MADQGLFGPSPWEIQQAQQKAMQENAAAYAQQSPLERAAGGMYRAGGLLGGMAAGALGGKNVAVENAKRTEQIMGEGDADLGTAAGMAAKAEQFRKAGDLRTATTLTLKASEMKKKEADAILAQRKEDRADKELTEVKIAKVTNQMQTEKDRLAANIARWAADANNESLSIEQRREAVRLVAQNRIELERMDNEAKLKGIALRESYGGTPGDTSPKINFNKMKDGDKWRIIKEQGADKATIGNASAQSADVVSLATKLLSHPGLESIKGFETWTNWAALPNSPAKGALTLLESLKSKAATVGRALASESGKLGNMAMGEWKIVSEDIANLDPASPEFEDQVRRIVKKTEDMEARLRQNYDETYSVYEGLNPALSASTLPPQAPPATLNQPQQPAPKPATPAPANQFGGVNSPAQVKQMYQAGKITREQAKAILADMDARGVK